MVRSVTIRYRWLLLPHQKGWGVGYIQKGGVASFSFTHPDPGTAITRLFFLINN